jgi:hypothetical protein
MAGRRGPAPAERVGADDTTALAAAAGEALATAGADGGGAAEAPTADAGLLAPVSTGEEHPKTASPSATKRGAARRTGEDESGGGDGERTARDGITGSDPDGRAAVDEERREPVGPKAPWIGGCSGDPGEP